MSLRLVRREGLEPLTRWLRAVPSTRGNQWLANAYVGLSDYLDVTGQWAVRDAVFDLAGLLAGEEQALALAVVLDEIKEALWRASTNPEGVPR